MFQHSWSYRLSRLMIIKISFTTHFSTTVKGIGRGNKNRRKSGKFFECLRSFKCRNYDSEIYAFGHRIGAPETDKDVLIRALTDSSFYQRADIAEESANAQPSKQESYEMKEHNKQLIQLGWHRSVSCKHCRIHR